MLRKLFVFLMFAVSILGFVPNLPAQLARRTIEVTPENVNRSIDTAVKFLKRKQNRKGGWTDISGIANAPSQVSGVTSLCTLALLNAGVKADDPVIARALEYLRGENPKTTYTVSLRTMVFCATVTWKNGKLKTRDKVWIQAGVEWLEKAQRPAGDYNGGWGYEGSASRSADNSNSQFAMLALHEAQRIGIKVKPETWRRARTYWLKGQNKQNGSWNYDYLRRRSPYASMTCAGIASLVVASSKIDEAEASVADNRIRCCGAAAAEEGDPKNRETRQAIAKGIGWLSGGRFSVGHHPGANQFGRHSKVYYYYYLYALERVGRMTSLRFLGKRIDWYRRGTKELLLNQSNDGSWTNRQGYFEKEPVIATSFALLFLSKGRRPVVVGRLKYGNAENWNQHRRAMENLTRRVERKWKSDGSIETDLTWQVIDVKKASVDDLLQTPVLFISGRDSFDLTEKQQQTLRAYVDQGGFIFAEGCCGGSGFDKDFRAFVKKQFSEASLLKLPNIPSEPLYTVDVDLAPLLPKFPEKHRLWTVHSGCRLGIVYCPSSAAGSSLSCLWELNPAGREDEKKYSSAVEDELAFGTGLGINVLAYATNRKLRYKYEIPASSIRKSDPSTRRDVITIAKLRHGGGCDQAPNALKNLLSTARHELELRVKAEPDLISISDPRLFEYHMVFMQGKREFSLSRAERKQLREYIDKGGTLLADSMNSSPKFTDSFRYEMKRIFGRDLKRIPIEHPMITPGDDNPYGLYDIRRVTLREPEAGAAGKKLRIKEVLMPPTLLGIATGDAGSENRWGVIFSPYDLSCALEKRESLQFPGYTLEDATKIGINVLLYSLQQ